MRFSENFGRKTFYHGISWNLLVTVLGCPCNWEIIFLKYWDAGNKFLENSGRLKFGSTENSQEMLDQYYLNNHGQLWVMSLYLVVK